MLVWSLLFVGGCLLEFAAQAAGLPAPPPSPGAATNVLTLDGAVRLTLENNPELRAAGGRIDAAAGRAYQARQWSNPELEISAEDWPVRGGGGFSDAKQTIGVAQTLPFPGKKSLDRKIGRANVRLYEAELTLRRTELVRDVKTAFFRVLALERLVEVSAELVKVAGSSAATARKRVEAGATAHQEQLRAEIQMEQARSELAGFEREQSDARQSLAALLGRPELKAMPVAGALPETVRPDLLEQSPEDWLARHPGMLAARAGVEQARLEERRARLEPYPDLKVGVAGGRIGETGQSIIQLGFSLPLPIIDRSKGRKQEAHGNVTVAQAGLAMVEQRLLSQWGQASQRYRTAIEQVGSYRERVLPKADEALRLVQKGFEEGKFGFMDLVDTQRTTAEVRLAYQQKLLELNIAQAELEALLAGNPGEFKPAPAAQF
jgi:outer membrane protein, heavy metal efflux system